jgi:hypothetical protein
MLTLTYLVQNFEFNAITETLEYAGVDYSTEQGDQLSLQFPPNSPVNESYDTVIVRGGPSVFLSVSRLAHTFPSSAVDAGLVDAGLRFVTCATLTELEDAFRDGRSWVCAEFDVSTAADVLLHSRLELAHLDDYPHLQKYVLNPPLRPKARAQGGA